jgi:6-phosphogluconolactonase
VSRLDLRVADDPAVEAAAMLVEAARAGHALALSGGSTPARIFELAAADEPNWGRASIWFGDERVVPPEDDRSNFKLAKLHLLDRLSVQPEVHRIPTELGGEAAADAYERELGALDLSLNGLGPDGHTGSLFPGKASVGVRDRRVVAAEPGLEPFVERVTLTVPAFNAVPVVLFVATGANKVEAVRRAFVDEPSPDTPASLVRGSELTVVLLDRAAAAYI